MNKNYKETIEVYKKLGKKYVDDTFKVKVKELPGFISILPKIH